MPKPEIVAELSSNHLGSYDRMIRLIHAAKDAGADAVKLQCWTKGTMARDPEQKIAEGPWAGMTLGELYEQCWTPWDWFPDLFGYCESIGIACFSSVFDKGALEFLETLNCPRYKISSFELIDIELIRAVVSIGKPIIMSTGMATYREIYDARNVAWNSKLTLLHCVSAYPAPLEDMNLAVVDDLIASFCDAGLSDHSFGWMAAVVATVLGAAMIEKHLTLSRADGGPDATFSAEPDEFEEMVRYVRQAALGIGEITYGPKPSERYLHLRRQGGGR